MDAAHGFSILLMSLPLGFSNQENSVTMEHC